MAYIRKWTSPAAAVPTVAAAEFPTSTSHRQSDYPRVLFGQSSSIFFNPCLPFPFWTPYMKLWRLTTILDCWTGLEKCRERERVNVKAFNSIKILSNTWSNLGRPNPLWSPRHHSCGLWKQNIIIEITNLIFNSDLGYYLSLLLFSFLSLPFWLHHVCWSHTHDWLEGTNNLLSRTPSSSLTIPRQYPQTLVMTQWVLACGGGGLATTYLKWTWSREFCPGTSVCVCGVRWPLERTLRAANGSSGHFRRLSL